MNSSKFLGMEFIVYTAPAEQNNATVALVVMLVVVLDMLRTFDIRVAKLAPA